MQSIIIKDLINEDNLLQCLNIFFNELPLSISYLDSSKNLQLEDIILEYIFLKGDFKVELCIYTSIDFSINELSLFICKQFKTEVLISDNSINPYSWFLITEKGDVGIVKQIINEQDLFLIKK